MKRTQAEIIRDHLAERGSISQLEASGLYCITDLAGRIRDIRNAHDKGNEAFPFDVVSETRYAPNGTRYVRYHNADVFVGQRGYDAVVVESNGSGIYLRAA